MTTQLVELMHEAVEEVREVDLAEVAWRAAQRRRSVRRRAWLGAAAASVAGVAAGSLVVGPAGDGTPRPTTRSTRPAAAPWSMPAGTVDGVVLDRAPAPAESGTVPAWPGRGRMALPEVLGFAPDAALPRLSGGEGVAGPVRAVLLRRLAGGGAHPVLYVPSAPQPWIEVTTVTVPPRTVLDPVGVGASRLSARTISPDRRRVVLPQKDGVVVLDTRTGRVTRLSVPGRAPGAGVVSAGWATDGVTVVVQTSRGPRLVDTGTGSTRSVRSGYAGAARIRDGGPAVLESFSGAGARASEVALPGRLAGTVGETVTNLEGWSAGAVLIVAGGVQVSDGVYAVQVDNRPRARALVAGPVGAGDPPALVKGGMVPRAWGPQDVLVYSETASLPGRTRTRLMAWDVIAGTVWRVAEVTDPSEAVGGFTGEFTISP